MRKLVYLSIIILITAAGGNKALAIRTVHVYYGNDTLDIVAVPGESLSVP